MEDEELGPLVGLQNGLQAERSHTLLWTPSREAMRRNARSRVSSLTGRRYESAESAIDGSPTASGKEAVGDGEERDVDKDSEAGSARPSRAAGSMVVASIICVLPPGAVAASSRTPPSVSQAKDGSLSARLDSCSTWLRAKPGWATKLARASSLMSSPPPPVAGGATSRRSGEGMRAETSRGAAGSELGLSAGLTSAPEPGPSPSEASATGEARPARCAFSFSAPEAPC
ncbi:hypothetical protein VTK73DRAFT_10410 [Phialemonium thermophilum]|uniref:Uncharacterized protein n=1 Tax=Phialemonium thermophilum TaxID=223376 RepID=A0ABR3VWV4_9PEZI